MNNRLNEAIRQAHRKLDARLLWLVCLGLVYGFRIARPVLHACVVQSAAGRCALVRFESLAVLHVCVVQSAAEHRRRWLKR